MKIKLLLVLGLMLWGWLKPDPVLAVAACVPEECLGERPLDAPYGCEPHAIGNYCETIYDTSTYAVCLSECRYPIYSGVYVNGVYYDLQKCAPGALPEDDCPIVYTTVGPGTCCEGEGGGGGGGGCGATKPSGLGVNWSYPGSRMQLTWTPGTGGNSQTVLASDNYSAVVEHNCLGASYEPLCNIKAEDLLVDRDYYRADLDLFESGTLYYFKVWNVASPLSCSKSALINSTYTAAACDAGVPTGLAANWDYSATKMELSWTPGGGTDSVSQKVMASDDETKVNNDCVSGCVVNATINDETKGFYRPLKSVFDSGTVYYFKVINVANPASCNEESSVLTTLSSCVPDPAAITGLEVGESRDLYASVVNNPVITRINFTANAPAIASVNPGFVLGSAAAYKTSVTGVSAGNTSVDIAVRIGANTVCTDNAPVEVINIPAADAWWQVVDGNLHADAGGVTSEIPSTCTGACKPNLITGATALLSFNGPVNLGEGTINQTGPDWQAETKYHGTQTGFGYFKRLVADDPEAEANGVEINEGDYSTGGAISVADGENRIILVNGTVTIDNNINVDPGGFLAIIASGNITVANTVSRVEGVFVADGTFSSGSGSQQLIGEGMFTGWTGFSLGRSLADNTVTPAEKFIYRPDLLLNAYRYLKWLNIAWREVAP